MRRRFLFAYVASIVIHLVIGAFFAIRVLLPSAGGASPDRTDADTSVVATTTLTRDRPPATPVPVVRAAVAPAVAPPVRLRPHPRTPRGVPRRAELAVVSPDGSPEPGVITVATPLATARPSPVPSQLPTPLYSVAPSAAPTVEPTVPAVASREPASPTSTIPPATPGPTAVPTVVPTATTTVAPTAPPSVAPTRPPTAVPTGRPTAVPTIRPTLEATARPTAAPTLEPTARPTVAPAVARTTAPTAEPTAHPTAAPEATALAPAATSAPISAPTSLPSTAAGHAASSTAPRPSSSGSAAGERAGASSGAEKAAATASASPARTAKTAYAPAATGSSSLDALNRRLNAGLDSGSTIAYSKKHYDTDLGAAVAQAEAKYYEAAAPPPAVLAKAIDVVRQSGTLLGPPTIVYILKRERILGIEICTGWQIVQTPSGPQGGYTFGSCSGERIVPAGGLPTIPPAHQ